MQSREKIFLNEVAKVLLFSHLFPSLSNDTLNTFFCITLNEAGDAYFQKTKSNQSFLFHFMVSLREILP